MKITTRITLALALVTGLTLATLAYQLTVVEKLQGINQELSLNKLEAGRVSLRLLQRVDGVQEFVAKSLILGDADYYEQWAEWEEAVDEDLQHLAALELSAAEEEERLRLSDGWEAYGAMVAPLRAPTDQADASAPPPLDDIDALLQTVRGHLQGLMNLTDAAVAAHVRASAEAGERASLVSWIAAGTALLLATLICILLYLSISGPLKKLTGGTRELARGNFEHRLEVRGEDELSDLARSFNRMARRLNELEEMKRDFVSHVSHELKGPLAAIHETILVLLEEIPGPLNEKQAHFLKLSHKSSERLSGMISNLLEVSRLEAGGTTYRVLPNDLEEIARSVIDEYAPVANEREIALEFSPLEGSAALMCDEDRIREVVANLVGNAIKFSPLGSRIRITLDEVDRLPKGIPPLRSQQLRKEAGPFLLLSVADQGIGVSDFHKEGIFEKFHQVKVEGRVHGQGVGLGLAISRSNVNAHGGAVWVEDAPEQGAIFRTLLPRVPVRWKDRSPWVDAPPVRSGSGTPAPPAEYTPG